MVLTGIFYIGTSVYTGLFLFRVWFRRFHSICEMNVFKCPKICCCFFYVHAKFVMGYIYFLNCYRKKPLRIVLFKYMANNVCKRVPLPVYFLMLISLVHKHISIKIICVLKNIKISWN